MDAKYYNGPDERDDFAPDYWPDDCPRCGAAYDEPCDPACDCAYCVGRRARTAARNAAEQKDVA